MFLTPRDLAGFRLTGQMSDMSGRKSRKQLNMALAAQGISVPKFLNQMTPEQQAAQAVLKQQQDALFKAGLPTIKVAAGETTMTAEQAAALQAAGLPTTMTANIGTKSTAAMPGAVVGDPLTAIRAQITSWQAQCASQGGTWDPSQGQDVPGFGKTGVCAQTAAQAPLLQQPQPLLQQPMAPISYPSAPASYGGGGYGGGGGYDAGGSYGGGGGDEEGPPPAPMPMPPSRPGWVIPAAIAGTAVIAGGVWYFLIRKPAEAAAAAAAAAPAPAAPAPAKA